MEADVAPVRRAPGLWVERNVTCDDTAVSFLHRRGTSAPVVFLHGFADAADCYQGLVARLPDSWDIFLLESAAHGRSGIPADGAHEVSRRRLTIQFLEQVTGAAYLVGHSMGAATALAVSAARPDLVRGLVLEDPPWFAGEIHISDAPATMVDLEDRLIQWILALQQQPLEQVESERREMCPHWDDIEYAHWASAKHLVKREALHYEYQRIPDSILDQWGALACSTLLLTGAPERSGIVTAEIAELFAQTAVSAQVSHHPAAGHDVRRDDPAAVSEAIIDFLSALGIEQR